MSKRMRKWYKVGHYQESFILFDFNEESVIAILELIIDDEQEHSFLVPDQDSVLYKLAATTNNDSRIFSYDPHSPEDAKRVIVEAMDWVEGALPPPVHYHSWPVFLLKSLLFWKYHAIWKGWRLVALIPVEYKNKLDKQQLNGL